MKGINGIILLLIMFRSAQGESVIGVNCDKGQAPDGYTFKLEECRTKINLSPDKYCYIPDLSLCDEPCKGFCTQRPSDFGPCTLEFECSWILESTESTTKPPTTPGNEAGPDENESPIGIIVLVSVLTTLIVLGVIFGICYLIYSKYIAPSVHIINPHQALNRTRGFDERYDDV